MSYANARDYKTLYPDTAVEDLRLNSFLGRASRMLNSEMRIAGVDYSAPDAEMAANLKDVCIEMVHRVVGDGGEMASSIPFGVSQYTASAQPYSESFTLSNPYGDMFMTAREKRMLGIFSKRIGFKNLGERDV